MAFSEKLYDLRRKEGLSQKALASSLGVSQASINYWEKGQRIPSIDMIAKISDYFHVSTDYLIDTDYISKKEEEIDILLNQSKVIEIVGKVFDPNAENMLIAYTLLNDKGKFEAFNRVFELAQLKKYTEKD